MKARGIEDSLDYTSSGISAADCQTSYKTGFRKTCFFLKKAQPSRFFGFYWFFWVLLFFLDKQDKIGKIIQKLLLVIYLSTSII